MAGALIGQTLNDLNLKIESWNVTSENFETWLSLQKALDALTKDNRYEILVWTCRYHAQLHTGGLVQDNYKFGMDIIKNNISVLLEHNPKNIKRLILIRIGYARKLPYPNDSKAKLPKNIDTDIVSIYSGIINVDLHKALNPSGEMLGHIHSWFEFHEANEKMMHI